MSSWSRFGPGQKLGKMAGTQTTAVPKGLSFPDCKQFFDLLTNQCEAENNRTSTGNENATGPSNTTATKSDASKPIPGHTFCDFEASGNSRMNNGDSKANAEASQDRGASHSYNRFNSTDSARMNNGNSTGNLKDFWQNS